MVVPEEFEVRKTIISPSLNNNDTAHTSNEVSAEPHSSSGASVPFNLLLNNVNQVYMYCLSMRVWSNIVILTIQGYSDIYDRFKTPHKIFLS